MEFYKVIKMFFFFLVQVSCTLSWPKTHFEAKDALTLSSWPCSTQTTGDYNI